MSGWECKAMNNENIPSQESLIDLDYYNTVEELMEVGPEKLKEVGLLFIFFPFEPIHLFILSLYSNTYFYSSSSILPLYIYFFIYNQLIMIHESNGETNVPVKVMSQVKIQ